MQDQTGKARGEREDEKNIHPKQDEAYFAFVYGRMIFLCLCGLDEHGLILTSDPCASFDFSQISPTTRNCMHRSTPNLAQMYNYAVMSLLDPPHSQSPAVADWWMRDVPSDWKPSNQSGIGPQLLVGSAWWGQEKNLKETKMRMNADLTDCFREELAIASGARLDDTPGVQVP